MPAAARPAVPSVSAARWMVPTLAFIAGTGTLGVTSKLALRSLVWQDLLLWVGVGYIAVSVVIAARGVARLDTGPGAPWAALSAALAITSVILLYLALETGEASNVISVSAAYPAVTLVLSALVLAERISPARVAGMVLVVTGVVILTAG